MFCLLPLARNAPPFVWLLYSSPVGKQDYGTDIFGQQTNLGNSEREDVECAMLAKIEIM